VNGDRLARDFHGALNGGQRDALFSVPPRRHDEPATQLR
jgi:hypothetical protein